MREVPRPSGQRAVFEVRVDQRADETRIAVFGELDLATTPALERALTEIEISDAKSIVLDLDGVDFLDSTGLRAVLEADGRSRADGSRLTLTRGSPQVQRLFHLVGADRRLSFTDAA